VARACEGGIEECVGGGWQWRQWTRFLGGGRAHARAPGRCLRSRAVTPPPSAIRHPPFAPPLLFPSPDPPPSPFPLGQSECFVLLDILALYVRHLEQYPSSLITRFYGCHSLQMYDSTMYFVVMENVFFNAGESDRQSAPIICPLLALCSAVLWELSDGTRGLGAPLAELCMLLPPPARPLPWLPPGATPPCRHAA
jgi:hypothetical protein